MSIYCISAHIMRILLLLLCIYASASAEDIFHRHLQNFLNTEADPCDNFYRYVCPVQMKESDTVQYSVEKAINVLAVRGWKREVEKSSVDHSYPMGNGTEVEDRVMAGLMLYIGLLSEATQERSPFHKVSKSVEEIGKQFSAGFRKVLNETGLQIDAAFEQTFLKYVSESLILPQMSFIKDGDQTLKRLVEFFRTVTKTISNVDETLLSLKFPEDEYEHLRDYARSMAKKRLLSTLSQDDKRKLEAVFTRKPVDVKASGTTVLNEAVLLALANNIPDAVMHGTLGAELAAAAFEQTLTANMSLTMMMNASTGFQNCHLNHVALSCELWNETICSTGATRAYNFVNVAEGFQAAFATFKSAVPSKGDLPYDDLKFTNEQLFFLSAGISACRSFEGAQATDKYPLSAYLRINGAFSLMPSFKEAFKCSKYDRMAQNYDYCNIVGKHIR